MENRNSSYAVSLKELNENFDEILKEAKEKNRNIFIVEDEKVLFVIVNFDEYKELNDKMYDLAFKMAKEMMEEYKATYKEFHNI